MSTDSIGRLQQLAKGIEAPSETVAVAIDSYDPVKYKRIQRALKQLTESALVTDACKIPVSEDMSQETK